MWTIAELKERGKAAFRANYWACVGVAFLMTLFAAGTQVASRSTSAGTTTSTATTDISEMLKQPEVMAAFAAVFSVAGILAVLFKIFVANPIEVGGHLFFKENTLEPPAPFSFVKRGFQNYGHNFVTLLLRDLFILLWTLLFIVPGLIKMYSYCMVPFILAEHPEMSATEVITRSREMMNGHKWRTFVLDLSFIGWILLGAVTVGLVQVFWTSPYMYSTHAALYLELKREYGEA